MNSSSLDANPWEEFDDASYTKLKKGLLKRKGSTLQQEFLGALRSRDLFCQWMNARVDHKKGTQLPVSGTRLSECQFSKPPLSTERDLFAMWREVSPAQASRTTFWGLVTLRHIEQGKIDPSFLVYQDGKGKSGRVRLEELLNDGDEKQIDNAVRLALRRMSGLPEVRGVRSVYTNCPFARAWWRCHLAEEVCEASGAERVDVLNVLQKSTEYWEKLIVLVVSRNSVVGDTGVRTALVWALSELVDDKARSQLFTVKGLTQVGRILGIRLAWQELSVLPLEKLKVLILREILPKDR